MRSILNLVILSSIALGVCSGGALPRPKLPDKHFIRSGAYGGKPLKFKNSKDYVRQLSNNPYRKLYVDFVNKDVVNKNLDKHEPKENSNLASLFDKNGMFFLTAPKKHYLQRDTKSLLQKKLDLDYASLELLSNDYRQSGPQVRFEKRPKSAYNSDLSERVKELTSILNFYTNKKQDFQQNDGLKYKTYGNKLATQLGGDTLSKQLVEPQNGGVDQDGDYEQEVLAILNDVKKRGGALAKKGLNADAEFLFEDLVV